MNQTVELPDGGTLVPHYMYRVYTKTYAQKFERKHVMTYMGKRGNALLFNARPHAGTQEFRQSEIIRVEPIRPNTGDSKSHMMNEIVR